MGWWSLWFRIFGGRGCRGLQRPFGDLAYECGRGYGYGYGYGWRRAVVEVVGKERGMGERTVGRGRREYLRQTIRLKERC